MAHFSPLLSFSIFVVLLLQFPLLNAEVVGAASSNEQQPMATNREDKLLLVQAVWRHGDRSPTDTFPNDPNKEEKWPQGWGQLTPIGMAQHVTLGQKLANKYINELAFVLPRYKSAEIYVRSTDLNRTLTSAVSNMIGFYGKSGKPNQDFPSSPDPAPYWPDHFVPVAIHTVDTREDHILPDVPDVPCPRQDKLQAMVKQTEEYKQLMEEKKWLFDTLSELSGARIDIFNFPWMIADTLFIEDLYEKQLKLDMPEWTKNATLRAEITEVSNLLNEWTNGKKLKPLHGVIHFDEELARLRGGPILWILIGNMEAKLKCAHPQTRPLIAASKSPLGSPVCQWIDQKKYFAYSAHDTTIAALFATFGFEKTNYDADGYPHYSSCVTLELWQNATSNEPYIKAFYWPPNKDTKDITRNITGCEDGCTMEKFVERSQLYRPIPSADAYCQNTHFPSDSDSDNSATNSLGLMAHMLIGWLPGLFCCSLQFGNG